MTLFCGHREKMQRCSPRILEHPQSGFHKSCWYGISGYFNKNKRLHSLRPFLHVDARIKHLSTMLSTCQIEVWATSLPATQHINCHKDAHAMRSPAKLLYVLRGCSNYALACDCVLSRSSRYALAYFAACRSTFALHAHLRCYMFYFGQMILWVQAKFSNCNSSHI